MTLYIDINNKKLVASLTSTKSVPAPIFMRGDNEPLEIFLITKDENNQNIQKILDIENDFLRVAIARFSDSPKILTFADLYNLSDCGSATITLPLNTSNLKTALENQQSLSALIEVEYSNINGTIITILQTNCIVKNQLIDNAPDIELEDEFYTKTEIENRLSATQDYIKISVKNGADNEYCYIGVEKKNGVNVLKIFDESGI